MANFVTFTYDLKNESCNLSEPSELYTLDGYRMGKLYLKKDVKKKKVIPKRGHPDMILPPALAVYPLS